MSGASLTDIAKLARRRYAFWRLKRLIAKLHRGATKAERMMASAQAAWRMLL